MSRRIFMKDNRKLIDLVSVGPATVKDLDLLGVRSVEDLAYCDASELYQKLCEITGVRHDPCAQDVFSAAIAQARDTALPAEQKQWWYWSQARKQKANGRKG